VRALGTALVTSAVSNCGTKVIAPEGLVARIWFTLCSGPVSGIGTYRTPISFVLDIGAGAARFSAHAARPASFNIL